MLFKVQIFAMFWGVYGYQLIPRIEDCGLTCSQGFLCRTQTSSGILSSFCHPAPASLSPTTLRSMKLWTAMKCAGQRQCSLLLSVKGTLHLEENIRGMEICYLSMETQNSQCVRVKISKDINVKSAVRKVKVQFNCFEVSAGQHLHVTMRTIPNYCGVKKDQEYYVEGWNPSVEINDDLGGWEGVMNEKTEIHTGQEIRTLIPTLLSLPHLPAQQLCEARRQMSQKNKRSVLNFADCRNSVVEENIPVCFASGIRIIYDVDRARKTISVDISEAAQGTDYYVRLCHQWFLCEDVGPVTLVQGKDLVKPVSLQYTQLLPCLCIEVWPAISDAQRTQLCPFKNGNYIMCFYSAFISLLCCFLDTKALWDNVIYNPNTQTLAWEAACPVHVTVSLCQLMKTNDRCVDLENTANIAAEKVKYSRVDAQPNLCMKFATKHGSWIRCPFARGNPQAWEMNLAVMDKWIEVSFMSQAAEAEFSVQVCNKTEASLCNSTGIHQPISVAGLSSTYVNISGKTCGSDICIQGRRTDVDYSIPSHICDLPCISATRSQERDENSLSILSLIALLVLTVTMMGLLGHKVLSVFHKESHKEKSTAQTKMQSMKSTCSLHL
ncbi:putative interleukin-17 receptor E-like [Zootoca vivipara]|uniref:putative interleukin-17 receptor E-like n=1 Tax=Zootoca vivipara TaxID=8524 RepID=UPI00293BA6E6|nr:putative interleukin-17 receptor E-like [Zootoca vivipara]